MGDNLPILSLPETVLYPDSIIPVVLADEAERKLVQDALSRDRRLVALAGDGEYQIGCEAHIDRHIPNAGGMSMVVLTGTRRVKVGEDFMSEPYRIARVTNLADLPIVNTEEVEALQHQLVQLFGQVVDMLPNIPNEMRMVVRNIEEPAELCHFLATVIQLPLETKQAILEERQLEKRLHTMLELLSKEWRMLTLGNEIQAEIMGEVEKTQREYMLRQQLRVIQEELDEMQGDAGELGDLESAISLLPENIRTVANREWARLGRTPESSMEYGVIRGYLEWITALPWEKYSDDHIDLDEAQQILDHDHWGLERVKDRILDYLAVSKLTGNVSGQILLLVGPPGVGKTSLGVSIAHALGREFARMSVGGIRDESEIRGHRRTYVGSIPGAIIRHLRDAGTSNPVFMIDEIDKMGSDWRGDPASAMLEVLDPAQNQTFRDHYLDLPYDLSKILFICTANRLDTIPAPLLDRMEIIDLNGYTSEDKLQIARRYLLPRQREKHGLKAKQMHISDPVLRTVIDAYTYEAGVRNLERVIARLCRKTARHIAVHPQDRLVIHKADLDTYLGAPLHQISRKASKPQVGLVTGLAVTGVGGDTLFLEGMVLPGKGHLQLTGQIGKVMEESAHAAYSYVASIAAKEKSTYFQDHNFHIHIPAGSIPKDGPSAGVALATVLMSMYKNKAVSNTIAMTGEVTLTGEVLPVGGIRDKVLAAGRAGITTVILPSSNEAQIKEMTEQMLKGIQIIYAEKLQDVWKKVF